MDGFILSAFDVAHYLPKSKKEIKRLKMKYPIYALGQVGIASVSKVGRVRKVWTSLLRLLAP